MSSMFKKKGGLAFKPKVPLSKARPNAPTRAPQPPKPVASQIAPEPVTGEPSEDAPETASTEAVSDRVPDPTQQAPSESSTPPLATTRPSFKEPESQDEPPKETRSEATATAAEANDGKANLPSIEALSAPFVAARAEIEPTPAPSEPVVEIPQEPSESASAEVTVPEPSENATPSVAEPSSAAPKAAKPKPRAKRTPAPRKKKAPEDATDEAADDATITTTTRRPTRKRKTRAVESVEDGDEATEEAESAPRRPRKTRAAEVNEDGTPRTRARKERSVTPEDAEEQTVDLQQIKMSDLTRDLRIGKKFSRHDELRERERQKKIKAKLQKEGLEVEGDEGGKESTPNGGHKNDGNGDSSQDGPAASGPQFRIVDGQIVLDQSSLVMDRHARAAAEQQDMEIIEENDFSRQITSNSYMSTSKLRKGNNWSDADTELFYRGLRMFGTDFEMISKMFPNKVRREVKLKFNREERHNSKMIDAAVIGEKVVKMDIDEYKQLTSSTFESVESIEAEQRKIEEDYEAERKRIADEQEETMRKKREALFADDKGDERAGAEGEEAPQGKKKKKRNKKQQAQVDGAYGDEEIALD